MGDQTIATANKNFSLNLFKILLNNRSGENVFASPFSVTVALAMTQLGARETTAVSMAKALCWPTGAEEKVHKEFQGYLSKLQKGSDSYSLSTANRIYLQQNLPVLKEFKEKTKSFYQAESVNADFATAAEAERTKINSWVTEQTKDKIKDLIAQGVLDALTKMVLVNAIYFKGKWDIQFKTDKTKPQTFKVEPGLTKEVPMMNANEKYALTESEELKCQAIEIPYKDRDLSMIVILPHADFGLKDMVEKLTQENLDNLMRHLGRPSGKVELSLPKFEVTSSHSLNDPLCTLGMSEAFSGSADFSGMTGTKDLNISAVLHKAFIKVNEEGTEAAAATAVVMTRCAMIPVRPQSFVADHPFLYVITDRHANGTILFIGAIVDPSSD